MSDKINDLEFNKSLVRRFLEVAVSKPDFDLFDELCGADYVWHGDAGPTEKNEVRGLENFKEAVADFTKALPDLKVTIEDMIAADDKVVVRIRERGTHTGAPFAGIQPSGKKVVLVVGSEDKGLGGRVRSVCSRIVTIEGEGPTGSLNLSVAAGIAINHVIRQMKSS